MCVCGVYGCEAIAESGKIEEHFDRHDARLYGAFAMTQPVLHKILGTYSPFYHFPQTDCYAAYYYQCRAERHRTVRHDQQLCNTMVPYSLIIAVYSSSMIPHRSRFFGSLPFDALTWLGEEEDEAEM